MWQKRFFERLFLASLHLIILSIAIYIRPYGTTSQPTSETIVCSSHVSHCSLVHQRVKIRVSLSINFLSFDCDLDVIISRLKLGKLRNNSELHTLSNKTIFWNTLRIAGAIYCWGNRLCRLCNLSYTRIDWDTSSRSTWILEKSGDFSIYSQLCANVGHHFVKVTNSTYNGTRKIVRCVPPSI